MIYCYYDKYGVLREIVNAGANRQGTSVNQIYAYFEDDNFASATITYQIGDYIANDSYFVGITSIVNDSRSVLPYNDKINYKYFKDNTPYKFYIFEIPDDILILNGVCRATITTRWSDGQPKHITQGLLTFNIESQVISDEVLLESQYQYLLDRLGAYEFIANYGIVGTLDSIAEGETAAESYREGSFILQRVENTSEYQGGLNVVGVKLYRVIGGVYSLLYSSVETTDLANYLNGIVYSHTTRINALSTRVDVLEEKIANVVLKSDLEKYAKKDDLRWYALKSELPTKLSQLENDTAFITSAVSDLINYYKKDETLSKEEILEKIAAIETIRFEVYASLDEIETPKSNVIYLIGTESPYKEYIYVASIGFEEIGKLEIDLSNYVQSDNVLASGNLVVGSGEKKVVDSGVSLDTTTLSNSANKIPTSFIVSRAIAQYHEVATINGDSGTITATSISSRYRLIVDENLLVYRRVLSETNKIVYHAKYLVDSTHTRDYFLTLTAVDSLNYNYVRTYIENVSHTEFDNLVSNTPTDLTYDSESGKMQLVHDGTAIGSGIVLESGAFTPYFDNSGLVLSDVDEFEADLSAKQDTLVSGTNIKTINGESILGSGDIEISGGGTSEKYYIETTMDIETFTFSTINEIIGLGYDSDFFRAAEDGNLYLKVNLDGAIAEIPLISYFEQTIASIKFENTLYFFRFSNVIMLCVSAEDGSVVMTNLCYDNKTKTLSGVKLGETPDETDTKILNKIISTTTPDYTFVNTIFTNSGGDVFHKGLSNGSTFTFNRINIDNNVLTYEYLSTNISDFTISVVTNTYTLTPTS